MFSDPLLAAMTMLLLFFVGVLVMFLFVIRSMSSFGEEMRESFRKQQMFLADLERQFMEMSFTLRRMQGEDSSSETVGKEEPADIPLLRRDDELLSMLEAAARKKPEYSGFDDQLLPPPVGVPPRTGEYEPNRERRLLEDELLGGTGDLRAPSGAAGTVRTGNAGRRAALSFWDE